MTGRMKKQIQLAFTGYHESKVKSALNTIKKNSKNFDVIITDPPIKHEGLLAFQPKLRGCDQKDLTVYSLSIIGTLENARNLVKTQTPLGVQIDLSLQPA